MIRLLLFPLADTLVVAEHAIAAPAHHPAYAQMADDVPAGPAPNWVKDDGTCLMGNGDPAIDDDFRNRWSATPPTPHGEAAPPTAHCPAVAPLSALVREIFDGACADAYTTAANSRVSSICRHTLAAADTPGRRS